MDIGRPVDGHVPANGRTCFNTVFSGAIRKSLRWVQIHTLFINLVLRIDVNVVLQGLVASRSIRVRHWYVHNKWLGSFLNGSTFLFSHQVVTIGRSASTKLSLDRAIRSGRRGFFSKTGVNRICGIVGTVKGFTSNVAHLLDGKTDTTQWLSIIRNCGARFAFVTPCRRTRILVQRDTTNGCVIGNKRRRCRNNGRIMASN